MPHRKLRPGIALKGQAAIACIARAPSIELQPVCM
jgi:hypothetical protein